jgi:serine/threonine protein kinase
MEKYKILKTLGDGTFGSVFKAINIKTRNIVAIK